MPGPNSLQYLKITECLFVSLSQVWTVVFLKFETLLYYGGCEPKVSIHSLLHRHRKEHHPCRWLLVLPSPSLIPWGSEVAHPDSECWKENRGNPIAWLPAANMKMLLYHRACLVWFQKGAGMGMVVMLSGAAAPGQTMSHVLGALSHHLQVTPGTHQPLSSCQLWLIMVHPPPPLWAAQKDLVKGS